MPATLDRREFVGCVLAAGGILAAPWIANAVSQGFSDPITRTRSGRVRGTRKDGVVVFKGVPYAGSPAGEGRFKQPPPLKAWEGVRDALLYGPQAIQPPDPNWPKEWKPAIANEDCLFLNVWTPGVGDRRKRPVMFYSHGGGFATGNGGADVAPQDSIARRRGARARLRRGRGDAQPPPRHLRLPLPGRHPRRGIRRVGRGRNARHRRGAEVGAREHHGVRRRPGQCDDLGRVRRGSEDVHAHRDAVRQRGCSTGPASRAGATLRLRTPRLRERDG